MVSVFLCFSEEKSWHKENKEANQGLLAGEWQPGRRSPSVCLYTILLSLAAYPNNSMNHDVADVVDNDDDECGIFYWILVVFVNS